jgi:AcrR family transcriptional regulator
MSDERGRTRATAYDSVWTRPVLRTGRPGGLTRDHVIAEAVSLLDEAGVGGLTMRALARRLGQSPMAIYHYVATRDDLLELAADAVFAAPSPGSRSSHGAPRGTRPDAHEDGEPARDRLIAIGERMLVVFMEHPWAPGLLGAAPPLGPNAQANLRAVVGAFTGAGLGGARLDGAVTAFYYFVLGAGGGEAAFGSLDPASSGDLLAVTTTMAGPGDGELVAYLGRMAERGPAGRFRAGLELILDAALRS